MGAIVPKEIPHVTFPYISKHNHNASCSFHTGYIGHSIEDCGLFKANMQELIDHKILSFSEEQPNMKTNPLLVYNWLIVNVIIKEECI